MVETVVVTEVINDVKVTKVVNDVIISSPGPQGPRGKSILNGTGAPSENFGLEGDFYYDKTTTRFYGPKLTDITWAGATNYLLSTSTLTYTFSIGQVINQGSYWSIEITHNMGYNPNVTVKNSAGDILETGIDYNSINKITLTMAQPFGGTAYLS
jgi:hypothetical protein